MYEYLSRNFTPTFNINNNTLVYYWDTDNKIHKKYSNIFNDENESNKMNILPFNMKAEYLCKLLNL